MEAMESYYELKMWVIYGVGVLIMALILGFAIQFIYVVLSHCFQWIAEQVKRAWRR